MKNLIRIIIVLLVCTLLGLWSPWMAFRIDLSDLFGVEKPNVISGMEVYSLGGELEIYLDGEIQGTANEESPLFLDAIEPGSKAVRIERKSDVPGAYWAFNRIISFEENITVIISYYIGPEEQFSSGHVINAQRKVDADSSNLIINSNISDFRAQVDGNMQISRTTRLESNIGFENPFTLDISKDGYESLKFTVLPDDRDEREFLSDYQILVDVHLLLIPVEVL